MKPNRFIAAFLSFIMIFSIFGTTLVGAEESDGISVSESESDAIQNDETVVVSDEDSLQQDVSSGESQTQDSIDINEDEDSNDATFVSNEENCSENEEPSEVISDNAAVDEENQIVLSDDNDINALIDEGVVKVFIDGESADIEILSGNEFSPYLQNRKVFAAYDIGTDVVYEEEHLYHIAIYGLSIPNECELYHFCDGFDNDASLIEKLNFKYDKDENSVSFDTLSFSPFVFVEPAAAESDKGEEEIKESEQGTDNFGYESEAEDQSENITEHPDGPEDLNIENAEKPLRAQQELTKSESGQDFTISMIHFDSAVGGGRTALGPDDDTIKNYETQSSLNETLTLQINYLGDNIANSYAPGELTFKVYGLEKFGLTGPTIANNLFSSRHVAGTYNPETKTVENDYWVFTNKNSFIAGESYDGMIQLVYKVSQNENYCPFNGSYGNAFIEYNGLNLSDTYYEFHLSKKDYRGSLTPYKVESISKFDNPNDYYWVKYSGSISSFGSNVLDAPIRDTSFQYFEFPEGVEVYFYQDISKYNSVVYNENSFFKLEPYETIDGVSKYKVNYCQRTNGSSDLFVGYPKSDYNVGDQVSASIDVYSIYNTKYTNSDKYIGTEISFIGTITSKAYRLTEFTPPNPGKLYSWSFYNSSASEMITPSNIGTSTKMGRTYENSSVTIYNEAPIDLVYGVDYIAIQNDSVYDLVDINDIYVRTMYIPLILKDLNNVIIGKNTVEIELYYKYKDSDEYVLVNTYMNKASGSYNIPIPSGTKVTSYYIRIKNLPAGGINISGSYLSESRYFYKEYGTFDNDGKVASSAFLMLYDHEQGTLLTPVSDISQYPIPLQETNVYDLDMNEFGMYMNRKVIERNILQDKYIARTGISEIKKSNVGQSSVTYEVTIQHIIDSTNGVKTVYGYDWYIDFPVICNVNVGGIKAATLSDFQTINNYVPGIPIDDREQWINNYLNNSTIEIHRDNNGKSILHIHTDFNGGVDISQYTGVILKYSIPITVYDADIIEYGGAISSTLYTFPILNNGGEIIGVNGTSIATDLKLYNISAQTDTGITIVDTDDIDGDGDISEKVYKAVASGNLTPAFDAQQDFSKLVKTDNNYWKPGAAYVESGHEYTYRLRARTAATGMTHLVLYDSIEFYSPNNVEHWQGMYTGIDLTRSEAQGYIPTVYYSTSGTPGALGEDASWTLYNDSVDLSIVRSLAFDYGDQIIQPNSIASVDIIVTAPETDSDFYAYNIFNASWIRVDPATGTQLPGEQEMSSNVTILSLNDPIDDYKEITISKVWDDNNDERGLRPNQISVTLYQDDEIYGTYTIKDSDNWTKTVSGLPWFDDDGNEYQYTVTEDTVTGYTTEIIGYTITNTIIPNKEVNILKLDGSTNEHLAGATLQLFNENNELIESWVSNGSAHATEPLPMGKTYRIHELSAPAGFHLANDIVFDIDNVGTIYLHNNDGSTTEVEQIIVYNYHIITLPATGSITSVIMQTLGLLMLASGATVTVYRRKRKKEEC